MAGYTKLFGGILDSTVWEASPEVRIVWITMLAMADRDGNVEASVPGLAKRAAVDRAYVEQALALFTAPDPDSRTKDHEGRRIEEIDGGWHLLNHGKYREKASAEEYREKAAERQRKSRERRSVTLPVTPRHALSQGVTPVTPGHAIAEASASPPADPTPRAPTAPVVGESLRFPEAADAANFNRRDLERAVSAERGADWRVPVAAFHVRQADETAAQIMAEAAKRRADPHALAGRAFRGWLESQKSVDPMVWCANWSAALPPPPRPQRERAIL